MKKTILFLLFAHCFTSLAQELDSDLYASLNTSSLLIFKNSEKSKMTISTLRNSKKNGIVEETESNYRKGKINPNKVNFNIRYSEFYVVENRKKSLGKYEFNQDDEILRYERTDFDNRNQRVYTFYHYFEYTDRIVRREAIRTKEYVGQGSVELDTVVYKDSVIYEFSKTESGVDQANLSDPGVHTEYVIDNGEIQSKTTYFEGFHEKIEFTYDSKGHLVKIINTLINEATDASGNTKSITTRTELHYSIDGLMTEAFFYDENNQILEKKIFTYK